MSARIAPEPVSVAVTFQAPNRLRVNNATRPVESAEQNHADRRENPDKRSRRQTAFNKARPPVRAPGRDTSAVPQALFDTALIAAEYKANAVYEEQLKQADIEQQAANKQQLKAGIEAAFQKKLLMEQYRKHV